MKIVIDFFIENWIVISGLVYELLARLIPTSKNWSAIDLVFKVLNFIIPNIQKKTLIVLLMLLPFMGVAQLNGNFKSVRFRPAQDTSTFRPNIEGTVIRSTDGNFYYKNADGFWSRLNGGLEYSAGSGINFAGQIINAGGIVTSDIVYEASIGTDFEMGTPSNKFESINGYSSAVSFFTDENINFNIANDFVSTTNGNQNISSETDINLNVNDAGTIQSTIKLSDNGTIELNRITDYLPGFPMQLKFNASNISMFGGARDFTVPDGADITIQAGNGYINTGNGGNIQLSAGNRGSGCAGCPLAGDAVLEGLNIELHTLANGTLKVSTGLNSAAGIVNMTGGTVTVNNGNVTANSLIFITRQEFNSGTIGILRLTKGVGTFTITSSSATENSNIAYLIINSI